MSQRGRKRAEERKRARARKRHTEAERERGEGEEVRYLEPRCAYTPPQENNKQKQSAARRRARILNEAISVIFRFWSSCLVMPTDQGEESLFSPQKRSCGGIFGVHSAGNRRTGAQTPFFATERPNFERRYLGQFSILGELFGGAVGKQYKATPPTPKMVV